MSVKALVIGAGAVVSAIAAIIMKGGIVWGAAGWETPNGHDKDISDVTMAVTAADAAAAAVLLEFQTRWLCDEKREELDELYAIVAPSPAVIDDIATIKTRMGDGPSGLQCAKFED